MTKTRSQWDSNPRPLDSESNAISTPLCDPSYITSTMNEIKPTSTTTVFRHFPNAEQRKVTTHQNIPKRQSKEGENKKIY